MELTKQEITRKWVQLNWRLKTQTSYIRKNITNELFKKILSNQISNKKKNLADFIINNNGPKKKTKKSLKKTLDKIISTRL